jgi:hypothetical protein
MEYPDSFSFACFCNTLARKTTLIFAHERDTPEGVLF